MRGVPIGLLLCLALPALPAAAVNDADQLLARARAAAGARAQEADRLGARVERTADGRSFALVWQPRAAPAGWIVTLHGSGSWAYDEVVLWRPFAERRGLGVVALQWWFGGGQSVDDYYAPQEMRRELGSLLAKLGVTPAHTLLHGFSRASANLYALVALDRSTPHPLFRQVIANSGGMSADFPPSRDVVDGRFGSAPYAGTRWWLYCGDGDPNPERDGCPAMRRTRDWLRRQGGDVVLNEDAGGDHGGFHRRGQNVEKALDWFAGG
ncbi:MAG: alpha/beta hydrolase [Candidatus Binatia bacterium]